VSGKEENKKNSNQVADKQKNKSNKPPVTDKKDKKETTEAKEEFKYIVRIANTDIDGEKTLVHGLATIKGIGRHMSTLIIDKAGLDRYEKVGNLSEEQIQLLQRMIEQIQEYAPTWMLNHRKDYYTGEDIHLIGPEIEMHHRDEINIMKKIRCYRGIRHELGLPVRGQRTRANNRKGLALGVSRKK